MLTVFEHSGLSLYLCVLCRYGSLFALYLGPHYTVVVNNHQHAREVLLQRGKDFAGRPSMVRHVLQTGPDEEMQINSLSIRFTLNLNVLWISFIMPRANNCHLRFLFGQVTTDLLTRGGKDIAFSDYTPLWKSHRRLVHNSFTLFGEGTSRLQDIGEKYTLTH